MCTWLVGCVSEIDLQLNTKMNLGSLPKLHFLFSIKLDG